MGNFGSGSNRIQIRMLPDLDPGKPDPDPDIARSRSGQTGSGSGLSGSGSGFAGSRSGEIWILIRFCRIQIRQYPELDPFWPDLDPGSGSKDMVMDPFRL